MALFVPCSRLFLIAALCFINLASLWKATIGCRQGNKFYNRLALTVILILNVIYLSAVWIPFSVNALNISLDNINFISNQTSDSDHNTSVSFLVEQSPLNTEKVLPSQNRKSRAVVSEDEKHPGTWNVDFYPEEDVSPVKSLIPLHDVFPFLEKEDFPSYISPSCDFQDLIISANAYSMAYALVFKMIAKHRTLWSPAKSWLLGVGSGIIVGIPLSATLLVRNLALQQSPYSPSEGEMVADGYIRYSMICDVYITETYVLLLFLEWAVLLSILLAFLLPLVFVSARLYKSKTVEDEMDKSDTQDADADEIDTWPVGITLKVGSLWAWPFKLVVVLTLFALHKQNSIIICWISHLLASLPVVYIPMTILILSIMKKMSAVNCVAISSNVKSATGTFLPRLIGKGSTEKIINNFSSAPEDTKDLSQTLDSQQISDKHTSSVEEAKANLKVYLGTDIFKKQQSQSPCKEDDQRAILLSDPNSSLAYKV